MKCIKQILLLCCLLCSLSMHAGDGIGKIYYGDEIELKSNKVYLYLALYDTGDESGSPFYLFTVTMRSSKNNSIFPETSKLTIKFANDSIIELSSYGTDIHSLETSGVERSDVDIEYTGRMTNPYYRDYYSHDIRHPVIVYYTGRHFRLEDTDLQKLLMWPIAKLQVELSDGKSKNVKVSKRLGKKVMKQLQDSWRTL